MTVFKTALQSILLAAIPKSVGSLFRIWDDWEAPKDIRKSTIQRESLLLGLTVLFTAMMRPMLLKPLIQKLGPQAARHETGLNVLAAVLGISAAEVTSRFVAPKQPWTEHTEIDRMDAERFEENEPDEWDDDIRSGELWQDDEKPGHRLNIVSPDVSFAQSTAPLASALPAFHSNYGNPMPNAMTRLSIVRNMFPV